MEQKSRSEANDSYFLHLRSRSLLWNNACSDTRGFLFPRLLAIGRTRIAHNTLVFSIYSAKTEFWNCPNIEFYDKKGGIWKTGQRNVKTRIYLAEHSGRSQHFVPGTCCTSCQYAIPLPSCCRTRTGSHLEIRNAYIGLHGSEVRCKEN